jgi:hypothetical protein
MMNMLGVSYGFTELRSRVDQAQARAEAANQQRILSNQENQARMAELRAGVAGTREAYYAEKAKSDQRKQIRDAYQDAVSNAIKDYATNLKNPSANTAELKRLHDIQLQNLRIERDNKLALLDDPNAAQEDFMQMGEAPAVDEAEQLFAEMRKNLKLWRAQGKTSGTWKSDGTIAEPGYFTNDMDLDELEAELNRREAAYRKDSGSAPQSTPSGGVILKRSDIFKK